MAKVRRSLLFLLISALSLLITTPTIVHAVTFVVDDAGDAPDNIPGNGVCATRGGVCTLRAAIVEANVLPGADTISIASGITQIDITYQLITTSDLTINGVGVTVDAGGTGRVFFVPRGALTINGLTITGGRTRAADEGGAGLLITDGADVILQSGAVVRGNVTEAGGGGVTVLNAGSSLHLRDGAQITGNSSPWGGGIGVGLQASVTITGSGTAITANEARWGGGLYVHAGATVLIEQDAVVSDHTDGVVSGGGVYIFGHGSTLRVNHATIAGNRATVGGGIYVTDAAQVTVENGAVITDNHATDGDGGGIYLAMDNTGLIVTESCISYNTAAGSGADVYGGSHQSCLLGFSGRRA